MLSTIWDFLQDIEVWLYDVMPQVLERVMGLLAFFTLGLVGLMVFLLPFVFVAALWKISVTHGIFVLLGLLAALIVTSVLCFLIVRR